MNGGFMSTYLQIYNKTKERILKGELKPGMKLPAHREMSSDYSVSVATITKVINKLKIEGLVDSCRGMGTMVAEPSMVATPSASKTICLVSHLQNFQNDLLSHAVQEVFAGSPWQINSRCTHSNLNWYKDYLESCRNNPPAGMIWLTLHPTIFDYTPEIFPEPCTQVVLMVHEIPGQTYDLVRSNLFADGQMLAEYLIGKQYKDCIYLSDAKRDEVVTSPLIKGMGETFREKGIIFGFDQTRLFENPHSYGVRKDPCIDSYNYVKQLLTRERPRVIVAGHDWCAMGAIRAIQDSGLSMPGDIAVVSAETIVDLSTITSTPTITGIDTLLYYRAKTAAEILKRRLEGDDRPVVYHEIHGRMQEGETA